MDNGYAVPEKTKNQSIRVAIKLADRITSHDYHYFYDLHNQKWGEPIMRFIPIPEEESIIPRCSRMEIEHPNAKTEEEKAQERKEFREAYEKDELIKKRDRRWFFDIMKKYHEWWWD
jgi:hypothetical protein